MRLNEAITIIRATQKSLNLENIPTVSANGLISRELHHCDDRPSNFYMIGSMGLASSIAQGVALADPHHKVLILDGDGNLLMNLGTLVVSAGLNLTNLLHILLDNGVYASTGDQPTLAQHVDLAELARGAGYRHVFTVSSAEELQSIAPRFFDGEGPCFLHIRIDIEADTKTRLKELGRVEWTPEEIRDRFSSVASRS